ncbi:hypothetical protein BOTBODRAFT_31535 [Botryobasidium botryosum FD-172 SS1]|uniref:Ribosomal protein L10 n=1 Tax=Botryobasidium botryosum (strain FD-172 SS1) TaxID=930990 RepID=A0A067MIN6_BOTB1|nr:hypothetical protein BOTBODRAFT_31535 [Botryobasidium botryosum FD-172 SS1]
MQRVSLLLRSTARPSSVLSFAHQLPRSYATHVSSSSGAVDAAASPRVYTARKTHLHAQYASLLASDSSVHLILNHANFSVAQLTKLRRDISAIRVPTGAPAPAGSTPETEPTSFLVIRPGIFTAALRTQTALSPTLPTLLPLLEGPIALISLPTLHPPALASLIRILDRAAPKPTETPKAGAADAPLVPALNLLGAIVSSQLLLPPAVRDTSKLPSLETLHAQIVGLISAPGANLVSVLGRARGGAVVGLLEGLKKSLEEPENAAPS